MSKMIYNYESSIRTLFSLAKPCDYNYRRLEHAGYAWRTGRENVFFFLPIVCFCLSRSVLPILWWHNLASKLT